MILMRIVDRYFYRCDELFLALGAGDAVDDMPRLKGKCCNHQKLNIIKECEVNIVFGFRKDPRLTVHPAVHTY